MSNVIQCRQCGTVLPRSDFPTGQFKCPDCNWTQLLSSAGRARPKKPKDAPDGKGGEDAAARSDATPAPAPPIAETPAPPCALEPLPLLAIDGLRTIHDYNHLVGWR